MLNAKRSKQKRERARVDTDLPTIQTSLREGRRETGMRRDRCREKRERGGERKEWKPATRGRETDRQRHVSGEA